MTDMTPQGVIDLLSKGLCAPKYACAHCQKYRDAITEVRDMATALEYAGVSVARAYRAKDEAQMELSELKGT